MRFCVVTLAISAALHLFFFFGKVAESEKRKFFLVVFFSLKHDARAKISGKFFFLGRKARIAKKDTLQVNENAPYASFQVSFFTMQSMILLTLKHRQWSF